MSDLDLYDREAAFHYVRDLARLFLTGEATTEVTAWDDGDFRVVAFHTIDATYPFEAEANDEEDGLPFYRERLTFSTTTDSGYVFREVVRRRCGRTGGTTVHREPVAWAAVQDPRTADATLTFDGEEHVLRDLELESIALASEEDAYENSSLGPVEEAE